MSLLSREQFKEQVFKRDRYTCIFCRKPAVDAHHIIDRSLWPDGGYYLDNGASVCEGHHWKCETTEITVERVRVAARIETVLLPPCLPAGKVYDKWGNELTESGIRLPGPKFFEKGVQKVLARGDMLRWFFVPKV